MRITLDYFTKTINGLLAPGTRTLEARTVKDAEEQLKKSLGFFLDRITGHKIHGQQEVRMPTSDRIQ